MSAEPNAGMSWDAGLNDQQRAAASWSEGPLAVLAGPGSGKTRVIIQRVARLLHDGAEPERVLCLAFNIKAAEEVRQRLASYVGFTAERVRVFTCHAYGRSLVRRFSDYLGLPADPEVMDSAQRRRLLREIVRERGLFRGRASEGVDTVVEEAAAFIAQCRHRAVSPRRCLEWCADRARRLEAGEHGLDDVALARERAVLPLDRQMAELFDAYEREALRRGLVTLDDYLWLPLRLLEESALAASVARDEARHIVVDEFQDWNTTQIELLTRLAPARERGAGPDLCVVGDDDQAIYAFRGADERAFGRFAERYPGHHRIELTKNYRSAPPIIAAANEVIRRAHSRFAENKTIEAANPDAPGSVEGVTVSDDALAGTAIGAVILADRRTREGARWRDYAVLVRTNNYLDTIARELEAHDIPVAVRTRPSPLDEPAVQDLLAWLELIADPTDRPHLQRLLVRPPFSVPPETVGEWGHAHRAAARDGDARPFHEWIRREQGAAHPGAAACVEALAKFQTFAATHNAALTVDRVVRDMRLTNAEPLPPREHARRVANIVQVMRFVADRVERLDPPGDVASFLRYRADLDDTERQFVGAGDERVDRAEDEDDPERDAVRVLSAHTAKGLEFDTVFVARVRPPHGFPLTSGGQRDQGLPLTLTGAPPIDASDEERRLFYVACTRARRRLVLVAKVKKNIKGDATDYFVELTHDAPDLSVPVRDGMELVAQAGLSLPEPEDAGDQSAAPLHEAGRLERAAAAARRDAAGALYQAERADITDEGLRAVQARLAEAAARLAAIAHLRAHRRNPALPAPDASGLLAEIIAGLRREEPHVPLTRALRAPLRLSFSAIKEYEGCPRCYYMKYVMGLDEPKTAELSVGDAAHKALEKWLKEATGAEGQGREPLRGRAALDRLLTIGREAVRDWPRNLRRPDDAEERLSAMLERAFTLHEPDALILGVEQAFTAPYIHNGVRHNLAGKIDRIEQLPDNTFRLVDYKTGQAWDYLKAPKPDDLQMSIYAMALPHVLKLATEDDPSPECPPGAAEYWVISTGDRGVIPFSSLRLDKARKKIDGVIEGMLAGRFEKGRSCKGLCDLLGE